MIVALALKGTVCIGFMFFGWLSHLLPHLRIKMGKVRGASRNEQCLRTLIKYTLKLNCTQLCIFLCNNNNMLGKMGLHLSVSLEDYGLTLVLIYVE